ncbi:MAG: elongation factor P [Patescibacteria group bacterium]|jgi:elongation factor P
MISTSDFKNGLAIMFKNDPWLIVGFQHVKPGKGTSFTRTRIKNLKNAKMLEMTFKSGEQFEAADLIHKRLQYLYKDENYFYFMDEKYEQYQLNNDAVGDLEKWMKEECQVDGLFLGENLFSIQLPPKMDFKITQAPPGVKGNTAANTFKTVTIETGAQISVPLFVNQGDTIRINTESGEYVSRV